jgi:hypothetical protein
MYVYQIYNSKNNNNIEKFNLSKNKIKTIEKYDSSQPSSVNNPQPGSFDTIAYANAYPDQLSAVNNDYYQLQQSFKNNPTQDRSPMGSIAPNCRFNDEVYNYYLPRAADGSTQTTGWGWYNGYSGAANHYMQYGFDAGAKICLAGDKIAAAQFVKQDADGKFTASSNNEAIDILTNLQPHDLDYDHNNITATSFSLIWSGPSDFISYTFHFSYEIPKSPLPTNGTAPTMETFSGDIVVPEKDWTKITSGINNEKLTTSFTNLDPNTTYNIKISGVNTDSGWITEPSNSISVTTLRSPDPIHSNYHVSIQVANDDGTYEYDSIECEGPYKPHIDINGAISTFSISLIDYDIKTTINGVEKKIKNPLSKADYNSLTSSSNCVLELINS